jgi:acetyl esterase/lipase
MSRALACLCRRSPLNLLALLVVSTVLPAQSTVRLYPGGAPASAQPTFPEVALPAEQFGPQFKPYGLWTFNVSEPSLLIYRPEPARSNGTAVIICPGGAYHFLAMQAEADPIARWLTARGVTAIVLKYRVVPTTPEHRARLFAGPPAAHVDPEIPPILPLEVADGRAALAYVRAHAAELGIVPTRVGMLGASAGSVLAVSLVLSADSPKPDFLALLYTNVYDWMRPLQVPESAPPLFIVVASDDQLGFAPANTEVYNAWLARGRSAELHAYAKGGHGFGMIHQGLPVDTWSARFEDWLRFQGLLTRPR